jgi:hypothetical protein
MYRVSAIAVFIVFAAGCARSAPLTRQVAPTAPQARYQVTISDNLDGALVRACFDGFVPTHLAPIDAGASRSLARAWSDHGAMIERGGRIQLAKALLGDCVLYQTRFSSEVFRAHDSRAVVVSQAQWLWRPEPFPPDLQASISLSLPSGVRASLPFDRDGELYTPSPDAFRRHGYNVFGSFAESRFRFGGASITVARLNAPPPEQAVRRWLTRAIGAAASAGEGLPTDRLHFVISPIDEIDEPVAFGMIRRGGGASVLLIPSMTAAAEELESDWVAIHELSHLWLPTLVGRDRWLAEGVATYLQEVLRARCGLQSERSSWRRLHEGFGRGRRSGTGRPLAIESRDMSRTGAYYRVYWAGTAFALEADLALRSQSDGKMTLLRALNLARPRLATLDDLATAEEVLSVLDDVAGSSFMVALGARYSSSSDFPPTEFLYEANTRGLREDVMKLDPGCDVTAESSR